MGCRTSASARAVEKPVVLAAGQISSTSELKLSPSNFVFHKTTPLINDYWIGPKLSEGPLSSVKQVTHKLTGQQRAVKSIRKSKLADYMTAHSKFLQEIDILRTADHSNVVKLYEFYEDNHFYHLVTEFLEGGELFEFILQHKLLSEPIAAHFMKQILSAVAYCHSKGIVHRDLKPENFLLDSNSSGATLKIIDFGTSALMSSGEQLHKRLGSPYYIAPEVLEKNYGLKCDIWSCGVILYILLSGKPPFTGKNESEILNKISMRQFSMEGPGWTRISLAAKSLINKMLELDQTRRLGAEELLHDPWFAQASATPTVTQEIYAESLANLSQFHTQGKFQQAVASFITRQLLNKEDTQKLNKTFRGLDLNGDGRLSREELFNGYSSTLGVAQAAEEVEKIMKEVDIDGNGYVEYSEFVMATLGKEVLLSRTHLEQAFRVFDSDGSGKISTEEFRKLLNCEANISESVWKEIIRKVDKDGDGEVDLSEFKEVMLSMFK